LLRPVVAAGACNGAPNRTPTRLPSADTTYERLAGGPADAVHAGSPPTRTGVCPHPGGAEREASGATLAGGAEAGAGVGAAARGDRPAPVQPETASTTAIAMGKRTLML